MKITIVADFCGELNGEDNNRFIYLANLLSPTNHVELITSTFNHTSKKHFERYNSYPFKLTLIDEPGYKKNISIRRFFAHYVWGKNVYKYLKKIAPKPDVLYCAMPTLKAAQLTGRFCKENDIKFIIDIQDLWPEAFNMVFDIPVISNLLFLPFSILANYSYRKADQIIAVSQTYVERALHINKTGCKGLSVFLGTNYEQFEANVALGQKLFKNQEEIWIGYCGSLSDSYDITCVIDAISLIKNRYIKLVIIGDGYLKNNFEKYARDKKVDCLFTGRLNYKNMCSVLCECDIVVNPIRGKSAASIINKHADYASSGKPVINNQDSSEYRSLISEYHMGINCPNGDSKSMSEAMLFLIDNPNERVIMGKNAIKCAKEKFDRKTTYDEIVNLICK